MKANERIAVARVFSDLIKADRIINTGEMEYWNKICKKYDITKELEIQAQKMTFSEALNHICNSTEIRLKDNFIEDCCSMTVSDGFCAHSEALIMMALYMMLECEPLSPVDVISIPKANFNIDNATALYIESDYDEETNNAIRSGYRNLFRAFQVAGFHFVYLPNIIDHYRAAEPELFRGILSFLAPSMSKSNIDATYNSLMQMTTGEFCKDILCNKIGITELRDTMPSLLIKIGISFVGDSVYANYLKITVDEDIATTVERFVERFCDMLSSDMYVVNSSEEKQNQFHYHGFYKQLLDIFLIRRDIRSRILIDPHKKMILFPDIETCAEKLHRREKALYALMLCQGNDAISFKQPKSARDIEKFNRRINRLQRRYAAIYGMFGGDKEKTPDLSSSEIRNPIVSCLRSSLNKIHGLYNHKDYKITTNADGSFSVNIEPELVYVVEADKEQPVKLLESELYKTWKSLS